MNQFQKKLLETYGGGDYQHLLYFGSLTGNVDEERTEWIRTNGGDTLLLFLWLELADDGSETMTVDTAVQRIDSAKEQLSDLWREITRQ